MKIRSIRHQILLLIALYGQFTGTKDFIFDLGGVLVLTNKMTSFRHVGMRNIISCSFQLGINPFYIDSYIKSRLFTFLDEVAILSDIAPVDLQQAYDEKGNILPLLISAWLQGLLSGKQITILIEQAIDSNPQWFKCKAEKRTIENTARLIFTPELLVHSRHISSAGIAFIKKCKREGHRIYGLSNWDADSFALMKEKHSELFDLFDGIVISAEVKTNKPHTDIYHILLNRYQLEPKNCWFIDDQQENIDAAQKLGINVIKHSSTFKKLIENIRMYSKGLYLS